MTASYIARVLFCERDRQGFPVQASGKSSDRQWLAEQFRQQGWPEAQIQQRVEEVLAASLNWK